LPERTPIAIHLSQSGLTLPDATIRSDLRAPSDTVARSFVVDAGATFAPRA